MCDICSFWTAVWGTLWVVSVLLTNLMWRPGPSSAWSSCPGNQLTQMVFIICGFSVTLSPSEDGFEVKSKSRNSHRASALLCILYFWASTDVGDNMFMLNLSFHLKALKNFLWLKREDYGGQKSTEGRFVCFFSLGIMKHNLRLCRTNWNQDFCLVRVDLKVQFEFQLVLN